MKILGIETSCDDTSVAIYDDYFGLIKQYTVHQFQIHEYFGGIVPELAARFHLTSLVQIFRKIFKYDISRKNRNFFFSQLDAISYTAGPGLIGSLLVGATFGHSLADSMKIPCIMINHIEGHLLSGMINQKNPIFPFIALLVSGGNTQLIYAKKLGEYIVLGKSLDDAVGHVFDYIGKCLGLSYPGGKKLSYLARFGRSGRYLFPRPMIYSNCLNFSFSGLKTCVKNIISNSNKTFQNKADIAKSFEEAVFDVLVHKCKKALIKMNLNNLVICGGVSANNVLKKKMLKLVKLYNWNLFFPEKQFCTDNAAMIAYAGYLRYKFFLHKNISSIFVNPKWFINNFK